MYKPFQTWISIYVYNVEIVGLMHDICIYIYVHVCLCEALPSPAIIRRSRYSFIIDAGIKVFRAIWFMVENIDNELETPYL